MATTTFPRSLAKIGAIALAACGGAAATAPDRAPGAAAIEAPTEARTAPVLTLGRELETPRFRILPDGTLRDGDDVFGRLEADGTLRRGDGSACLRVDPDGALAHVPPSRARNDHGIGFRIDGDALFMTENGRTERIMEIADGTLVVELERNPIAGLTPEYHRTVLAAYALYFMMALAEGEPRLF
jgi:hypothetical protein